MSEPNEAVDLHRSLSAPERSQNDDDCPRDNEYVMRKTIIAIQNDPKLTMGEKARKIQVQRLN